MALSRTFNILLLLFVVLSTILIVVSCGGNDSSFINTNQNVNTPVSFTYTPTPALTSVPVNAYVYLSNTSLEDGENVEQTTVLDIPAVIPDSSGSTPLLTQLSALQQENPQDWQGEDMKELSDKLSAILKDSQVLPQTAKVFTVYQDSLNESPIPVNNEGYISGQAIVGDKDTNVQLEVSLDDDHYIDAETIIPSNNLISSDATGATLKSCPEKVFVLPGEVIIIQITSTTGINLKEAGLTFSLKNPNLGCITSKPIFLEICGKKKYEKAYCLFYAKKNLTTPIDTVITAKTSTGLQLDIFTEIIKSTASISGKIFTTGGKPLIKGYVKSIGPKAFCKIDSSGNYTLPRVFRGHFRKITATYWIEDNNGKKIRHREEKIIDFFSQDVTGFNFGVPPTPTPTLTPIPITDAFCFDTSVNIMMQRDIWAQDSDVKQAIQKTVQWLNGNMPNYPTPQGIASADVDNNDPTIIWINFADGKSRSIHYYPIIVNNTSNSQNSIPKEFNKVAYSNLSNKNTTVGSAKVKILAPFGWQDNNSQSVHNAIWKQLKDAGYDEIGSVCKVTEDDDIEKNFATELTEAKYVDNKALTDLTDIESGLKLNTAQIDTLKDLMQTQQKFNTEDDLLFKGLLEGTHGANFTFEEAHSIWSYMKTYTYCKMTCSIAPNNPNNPDIIRPEDFQDLDNYGIIYIATHGSPTGISLGPKYEGDNVLKGWLDNHTEGKYFGEWNTCYVTVIDPASPYYKDKIPSVIEACELHASVIEGDFSKSLVYINACSSYNFIKQPGNPFSGAKAYLGYDRFAGNNWARDISYYFFLYMIDGYKKPIMIFAEPKSPTPEANSISDPSPLPSSNPMSIQQAMEAFSKVTYKNNVPPYNLANPDPHDYSDTDKYPNTEVQQAQGCTLKAGYNTDPNEEIYFPVPVTITIEKK